MFTKQEVLLLRRAVNALRTRQELNTVSCSPAQAEEFRKTIRQLDLIDNKLCCIKPEVTDCVSV